jgi:hypothetical protein
MLEFVAGVTAASAVWVIVVFFVRRGEKRRAQKRIFDLEKQVKDYKTQLWIAMEGTRYID